MRKEVSSVLNELKLKRTNIEVAIATLEAIYGKNGLAESGAAQHAQAPETLEPKKIDKRLVGEGTLEDGVACVMSDGKARDSWEVAHELKKIGLRPKRQSVLASLSSAFIRGELTRPAKGIYQKPLSVAGHLTEKQNVI